MVDDRSGQLASALAARAKDVGHGARHDERKRCRGGRLLDLGCGAGRNALPLARLGWNVVGMDLSRPMLLAAAERAREEQLDDRLHWMLAPMDALPMRDRGFDLVVAHGIWNLGRAGRRRREGGAREGPRGRRSRRQVPLRDPRPRPSPASRRRSCSPRVIARTAETRIPRWRVCTSNTARWRSSSSPRRPRASSTRSAPP